VVRGGRDRNPGTGVRRGRSGRAAPLEGRAVRAWQQQVESERAEARFNHDLKTELGETKVPEKATDWIKSRTAALGNNPKALKQAVEEFRAIEEELRGPTRKPTPHPPSQATAGEQKTDPRDRNARARMAAAIEAANQQQ
jgi:hypothetical protein